MRRGEVQEKDVVMSMLQPADSSERLLQRTPSGHAFPSDLNDRNMATSALSLSTAPSRCSSSLKSEETSDIISVSSYSDLAMFTSSDGLHEMDDAFCGSIEGDSDLNTEAQPLEACTTTTSSTHEEPLDNDSGSQPAEVDSNSTETAKAFVPCKVCGDKASGYHYGVTSCEGCKGFFRRSIQKQIEYRCLRDGRCQVLRLNRNRCQFCRFKKCLAVGMSRDSVRYGRVPKSRGGKNQTGLSGSGQSFIKSKMSESVISCTSSDDCDTMESVNEEQLAIYDTILTVTQAHNSNCFFTDDRIRHLSPHPAILSEATSSSSPDSIHLQRIIMWQNLACMISPSIQRVVEFAKRTPGFCELSQEDQLILIKGAFMEIWLIHSSKVMRHQHITFPDGSFVTKQQLDLIFETNFSSVLFKFAAELQQLNLNDNDIALFSAVALYCPDRTHLSDVKLVERMEERLKEALRVQMTRHRTNDLFTYQCLIARLPDLRQLTRLHNECLQWYRRQYLYFTNLPPLFAEIFDIPKTQEEFQILLASSTSEPDLR